MCSTSNHQRSDFQRCSKTKQKWMTVRHSTKRETSNIARFRPHVDSYGRSFPIHCKPGFSTIGNMASNQIFLLCTDTLGIWNLESLNLVQEIQNRCHLVFVSVRKRWPIRRRCFDARVFTFFLDLLDLLSPRLLFLWCLFLCIFFRTFRIINLSLLFLRLVLLLPFLGLLFLFDSSYRCRWFRFGILVPFVVFVPGPSIPSLLHLFCPIRSRIVVFLQFLFLTFTCVFLLNITFLGCASTTSAFSFSSASTSAFFTFFFRWLEVQLIVPCGNGTLLAKKFFQCSDAKLFLIDWFSECLFLVLRFGSSNVSESCLVGLGPKLCSIRVKRLLILLLLTSWYRFIFFERHFDCFTCAFSILVHFTKLFCGKFRWFLRRSWRWHWTWYCHNIDGLGVHIVRNFHQANFSSWRIEKTYTVLFFRKGHW